MGGRGGGSGGGGGGGGGGAGAPKAGEVTDVRDGAVDAAVLSNRELEAGNNEDYNPNNRKHMRQYISSYDQDGGPKWARDNNPRATHENLGLTHEVDMRRGEVATIMDVANKRTGAEYTHVSVRPLQGRTSQAIASTVNAAQAAAKKLKIGDFKLQE